MRYLAAAIHFAVATFMTACLAVLVVVAAPFIGLYRLARWAELKAVYGGDEKARDKDRWREL